MEPDDPTEWHLILRTIDDYDHITYCGLRTLSGANYYYAAVLPDYLDLVRLDSGDTICVACSMLLMTKEYEP
jgi:hypothetical protein